MADFDKLIEDSKQCLFNWRHGIFIEHPSISLDHLDNKESILELMMNGIISLVFNDLFYWS